MHASLTARLIPEYIQPLCAAMTVPGLGLALAALVESELDTGSVPGNPVPSRAAYAPQRCRAGC